ncbi:MAG: tRNA (adenosine(37)-N6)-threonylcarbamoyltransferase complex dimerization subunit type 1 TsaB [Bacteroidota bacterium]|nr:tRNA (adenosine(37)-N6)-threonylcarbamoyltransferase complex dimerization subunit type 1 TsaB [Bacteroidota bacterium]
MPLILNLESSTEVCSVVLSRDGEIIASRENAEGQNHAKLLTVFVEEIFKETGITAQSLDAVAVSSGPGSYTGLRIGVSTAKGICYAAEKPLIAVSPLQSMAHYVASVKKDIAPASSENILFCPMIDARRMEVYTALYDSSNTIVKAVSAQIIDENSFREQLESGLVLFFGNGSEKCRKFIVHENAYFVENVVTSARFMYLLAEKAYRENRFVDVAYYEPFYLKDFIATIPTKNVFK